MEKQINVLKNKGKSINKNFAQTEKWVFRTENYEFIQNQMNKL